MIFNWGHWIDRLVGVGCPLLVSPLLVSSPSVTLSRCPTLSVFSSPDVPLSQCPIPFRSFLHLQVPYHSDHFLQCHATTCSKTDLCKRLKRRKLMKMTEEITRIIEY